MYLMNPGNYRIYTNGHFYHSENGIFATLGIKKQFMHCI